MRNQFWLSLFLTFCMFLDEFWKSLSRKECFFYFCIFSYRQIDICALFTNWKPILNRFSVWKGRDALFQYTFQVKAASNMECKVCAERFCSALDKNVKFIYSLSSYILLSLPMDELGSAAIYPCAMKNIYMMNHILLQRSFCLSSVRSRWQRREEVLKV